MLFECRTRLDLFEFFASLRVGLLSIHVKVDDPASKAVTAPTGQHPLFRTGIVCKLHLLTDGLIECTLSHLDQSLVVFGRGTGKVVVVNGSDETVAVARDTTAEASKHAGLNMHRQLWSLALVLSTLFKGTLPDEVFAFQFSLDAVASEQTLILVDLSSRDSSEVGGAERLSLLSNRTTQFDC